MSQTEITKQIALDLGQAAYECDAELRPEYSGRGMFGRSCPAIVCGSENGLARCLLALVAWDADYADLMDDLALDAQVDSLGHRVVWYFPGYKLDQDALDAIKEEEMA